MLAPLSSLPETSRIWIFAADRPLTAGEATELLAVLDPYLEQWKAHGAPVRAARELRDSHFLVIAADPEVTAPSGCSIDDMTRTMKTLGARFGVDFFAAMRVYHRAATGEVRVTDRATFRTLAATGAITPATTAFDLGLTTLADLRAGRFEQPVSASWHRALLPA